jgi:hypothetical protein
MQKSLAIFRENPTLCGFAELPYTRYAAKDDVNRAPSTSILTASQQLRL